MSALRSRLLAVGFGILLAQPASASFHFMQIERVIGGVGGNTGVQGIQLRMRSAGQNLVSFSRLYAWDAAGLNPVLVIDITSNVANSAAGAQVLIGTSNFHNYTNPSVLPDFVLTNLIPASYLAAGSLTFEDDFGTIYWRLSWGGTSYTGSGLGSTTNDPDGNFNPAFLNALPSADDKAVFFIGPAAALSTDNRADYATTLTAATFTNNAGQSGTITTTPSGVGDGIPSARVMLGLPMPNPASRAMSYSVSLPRQAAVRVRLMDLNGRLVRKLVDQSLPAGRHEFTLRPASALSSGIYYLWLEADGVSQSRRFTLLR